MNERYSIDADPDGIRALVADAIHGALAFGFQGVKPPPEGHWLTMFWKIGRDALAAQPAAEPTTPKITVDFRQATELLELFGGEPADITLMTGNGHSGPGLYAVFNADPDGAVYLGEADEEAVPVAAQPARAGGDARMADRVAELEDVLRSVDEQFRVYGDRLPDGFDSRVFRWVKDALAAAPQPAPAVSAGDPAHALLRSDQCDQAYLRDFVPYKGNPDPLRVWRTAWNSCCAAWMSQPAPAEQPAGVADELAKHLRDAHAFIENTDAFGRTASRGILNCGGCIWNVDESKAALSRHEAGATTAPTDPLTRAVEASEEGHDPLCMSILRGKDCSCGRAETAEQPAWPFNEPIGEIVDMKYGSVRFNRNDADGAKRPYLQPGTKLYLAPQEQPSATAAPAAVEREASDKDRADAARYRWLTKYAHIGECYTDDVPSGVILEVHGTDRRVPDSVGFPAKVDATIDAAIAEAGIGSSKEGGDAV